jgi:hypothetical protein
MYEEVDPDFIIFSKPGFYLVEVDAETAKKWLQLNIGNRRLRKAGVSFLRSQIENGEWQSSHPQPIVFSDTGRLIDGQHRLTAIAEAVVSNGKPLKIMVRVETGAPDGIREYLDSGIGRTLEDRADLDPDPGFNRFITQLVNFHQCILFPSSKSKKTTPAFAKDFYRRHSWSLKKVYELNRKEKGTGQVAVSLAAMQYFEINEQKAGEFYADLFIAAGRVQQAQMLRDFLIRQRNIAGGLAIREDAHYKAIGCMKAHREGREIFRVNRVSSW